MSNPGNTSGINTILAGGEAAGSQAQFNRLLQLLTQIALALGAGQTGSTAWTPTDGSGAGLAFTGVSAGYSKAGNMVFAYGQVTYPSNASGAQGKISGLPAVPNQAYAATPMAVGDVSSDMLTNMVQNSSPGALVFTTAAGAAVANSTLAGQSPRFLAIYPLA